MKKSEKVSIIENILGEILAKVDIEIVELEYKKENGQQIFRVYIDTQQGVDFDICTKASKLIKTEIDSHGDLDYDHLEVSSPGIDRLLKRDSDFLKFKGSRIKIRTKRIDNVKAKNLTGILHDSDTEKIFLQTEDKIIEIPRINISTVRLHPDL